MTPLERYVGQVLDEKYRLERLLGQGGMGAVYLATHLGTERYVALKLITPQFMRNEEFVERFKREARAAGRLRHPNVVDVTDFGFSGEGVGRVAYLVMEYLDGCTLSDVLVEEERLPLYWVVDILEQVCAAVHEAHQQGIIHRDLKPDNIWLEPNGLGGYRVKVLDFGIAKLAEAGNISPEISPVHQSADNTPTMQFSQIPMAATAAAGAGELEATRISPPSNLESETLIQSANQAAGDVQATQAAPGDVRATQAVEDGDQTRILDGGLQSTSAAAVAGHRTTDAMSTAATTGLTRVGAILGTPLYMSPEQCRGEGLDARSDIYSLGVIAYQMLSGAPPFTGETATVIRAHTESQPTALREHNRKLPKRVSRLIMSFALYSEYFPEFFKLSLLAHIPLIVLTVAMLALRLSQPRMGKLPFAIGVTLIALLQIPTSFVTASIISGVTAIIVTQLALAPMKPVELRAAFAVLRSRWRPFLRTGVRVSLRILLGFILLVIPGIVMSARYLLWAPVVLLEGLEKKEALKRARALAARSWRTIIAAMLIQFLVPAIVGAIIGAITGATGTHGKVSLQVKITGQLSALINIFILPLLSIVPALLYLKMRQFGGETLNDVMAQIEEVEGARSTWRQRMRTRLTVNTPHNRTPS